MQLDWWERADRYNQSEWATGIGAASRLVAVSERGRDVWYGRWLIGQDYRNKSGFYGAYPHGLLDRIAVPFPDAGRMLHAFSGSLPPGPYLRCDAVQPAEFRCNVLDLAPQLDEDMFDFVMADPPYSTPDAKHYGTPMINRGAVTRALARIVRPGGTLGWLDTTWPMHRKDQWQTRMRIAVTRSTNHRSRDLTFFERVS